MAKQYLNELFSIQSTSKLSQNLLDTFGSLLKHIAEIV